MRELLRSFRLRVRALIRRPQLERDLEDELAYHMAMRQANGPAAAPFGNATRIREMCRDIWTFAWLETLMQDLRYGIRSLAKSPGFTVIAVLSLALGIMANSTIFSVLNAVLFRPLPYPSPERLVTIWQTRSQGHRIGWAPVATAMDWRQRNSVFEDIALADPNSGMQVLTGKDGAESIRTQMVSPSLFQVLGVRPSLGRGFDASEVRKGERAFVISHGFWKRKFGESPDALGRALTVDGSTRVIIGIMPPDFSVLRVANVDLWTVMDPDNPRWAKRNDEWMLAIARMKPTTAPARAQAELDVLSAQLARTYPEANRDTGARVQPLSDYRSGGAGAIYPLMGAVAFVLLIACANLANLLLARTAARQAEITLRAALGASRWRLTRQLLTESWLLAILGGATGLLLTGWGIRVFRFLAPTYFPGAEATSADGRVILFTLAISTLTGILFGMAPAISAGRVQLNGALKNSLLAPRRTLSGSLVVAEVALSLVLLVGAGLMINTVIRLQRVNLGIDSSNVLTMEIFLQDGKYWRDLPKNFKRVSPEVNHFFPETVRQLQLLPGVQSAGFSSNLPSRWLENRTFAILDRPATNEAARPFTGYAEVSSDFFKTLRIPLKRGRYVSEHDQASAPWVVMVNETLARRYFPNEDPLGKSVRLRMEPYAVEEDRPRQIVGIVGDVLHQGPTNTAPPAMYAPFRQQSTIYPGGRATGHLRQYVAVRLAPGADAATVAAAGRRIAGGLDKGQLVEKVMTMEEVLSDSLGEWRFYLRILGIFAAMALVMAAIGIYGVISYAVNRRTREIGIRMALGAQHGEVIRLVIRRGLLLTAIGIAAGVTGALGLTRFIERLLFGVTATDPLTFGAVALLLASVALLASYLPARRAVGIDPVRALRVE